MVTRCFANWNDHIISRGRNGSFRLPQLLFGTPEIMGWKEQFIFNWGLWKHLATAISNAPTKPQLYTCTSSSSSSINWIWKCIPKCFVSRWAGIQYLLSLMLTWALFQFEPTTVSIRLQFLHTLCYLNNLTKPKHCQSEFQSNPLVHHTNWIYPSRNGIQNYLTSE